ncbi:MAG: methyltransferase domain-containing protein [Bauldia sp.]|nr:methyltransferase domain-containing protein [Bauldia sp.]
MDQVGDKYVLPTGSKDAARLDVIHEVYGPLSVRGLEAAGMEGVRRAADIGCGTGTMSRWLAERMGDGSTVDAIDISEDQLAVARTRQPAAGAGTITYSIASAYEPELPDAAYDIAFVRLVLCHLKEPHQAVAAMARLLKPGGRLVIVDMDMYSFLAMPPSEHYTRWLEGARVHQTNIGVDYAVGTRLHELLSDAGLETTYLAADQPIYNEGAGKNLWQNTWRNAVPYVVQAGSLTPAEGDDLIAGMASHDARPDVWIGVAKMFAAVGRKVG